MHTTTAPRAGIRQWLGLSVLLLPTMLLFLAMTVLFLATPYIAAELRPSSEQVLWINDIYGFIMAGFLVTLGTLGDRLGRRKLLLAGAALFGAASVLSAYAPNPEMLIAGRALMGLGAAAIMPATLSLITHMFGDARQRAVAIGLWASSISAGVALGPLIGGLLLESLWWGAALLIGVPIMALVLVAVPLLVPEYRDPNAGRVDLPSVALSLAAMLPFVYGVKQLAESGVNATSVATLVVGVVSAVVFTRRQLRLQSPLLDMRLFRDRTFSGALGMYMLAAIALVGVYLLFTQYLQLVADQSPLEAGLWILPAAIVLVVVSTVTPIIARKVRPAYIISTGLVLSAVGYLLMSQVESVGGLPLLITGFYILYPGIAPAMALAPGLVVGAAPPEKAGAASAVSSTASDLGTALGVAILGSVGSLVYGLKADDAVGGLTADQAAEAGETLPGALEVAASLPAETAGPLAEAAKAAFTSGLNVVGIVAAALAVAAVVLTLTTLRHVRPTGTAPAPAEDVKEEEQQPELAGTK
ncbi:MFS transporter [Kribbella catacumbae]|uniref:MFS transporter n=1 Tax=Kribbella catacumbae TaxID=460086 RepID=UPI00058BB145|nr:MFS transporter [Kribbella catacumbae]